MDLNNIMTFINTVGFPIACVLACGWFIWKTQNAERQENAAREERYLTQITGFKESLDRFNETLIRIDSRLGEVEKKLDK